MIIKYRVHEVAKDLNVPSKDVIDLLGEHFDTPKKHMTALTEQELNLVFEYFTQKNQVKDFNAYFASGIKKEAPKAPAKPAVKAPAPAPAKSEPAEAKAPAKAEEKSAAPAQPAPQKTQEEKPAPAPRAQQPASPRSDAQERPRAPYQGNQQGSRPTYQGGQQNNRGSFQGGQQGSRPPYQGNQQGGRPAYQGDRQNNRSSFQGGQQGGRPNYQGGRPSQDGRQGGRPAHQGNGRPFQKGEQGTKRPAQNKQLPQRQAPTTAGTNSNVSTIDKDKNVRHVDMRAAQVDLDKYNEHYEQIAPASAITRDNVQKKQKINQRSAQRGKYGRKKETEAEKLRRIEAERAKRPQMHLVLPEAIVVGELASKLMVPAAQVIKKLMGLGVMATVTETIDYDTAALVAMDFGAKVEKEVVITIEERLIDDSEDDTDSLQERSPVVVVMGHVDHGKTSLLDAIRHSDVTATEAGGITQHIGAYRVKINDKYITFLDTPGHEAFTSMRARGAQVTDIAILVVAADDGIMPQTVEAINHAKAAGVSIIVAINKMDKPEANPEKVKQELTEYELVPEEWGGDVICVPVSAKTHENIDTLLEMVQLVADMKELKANPDRLAKGTVIEAKLDKGRGPVATVLVQNGTLHTGDVIIAGTALGHVRVMLDDRHRKVTEAGPSVPVEITGLSEVPSAGDIFNCVEDEKLAKELVEQRKHELKEEQFSTYQKVTLDNLFSQIEQGEVKELPIIIKADVQGSVEAVRQSLEKLSNDEVRVKVIHGAVGAVSESDVMLADASNAIIVGFNVRPDPVAKDAAERDGVEIRLYRIIYDAIEEIKSAMKGMLAPKYKDVDLGRAEVRQVYKISNVGAVAGCYVLEGKITRSANIRIVRDGIIIADDKLDSLKRFKDDVKEVASGYECGMSLEKFNDIKEGDIFEAYVVEEYRE